MAVSPDGTTLALSDSIHGPGAVVLYSTTDGSRLQTLNAPDGATYFGAILQWSPDGSTFAVTSVEDVTPAALYLFKATAGKWAHVSTFAVSDGSSHNPFTQHLAFSPDSTALVVGALNDATQGLPGAGAAYLFTCASPRSAWSLAHVLTASTPLAYAGFGWKPAFSPDSSTLIVSAIYWQMTGAIYVFSRSAGAWSTTSDVISTPDGATTFGDGTAFSPSGSAFAVAATNADAVYVYRA